MTENRSRTAPQYVSLLRKALARTFPLTQFSYNTSGMLTAALNFGLPSPINVQVEGNDLEVAHGLARQIRDFLETVPGTAAVRIQQRSDYPLIRLQVDRIKAAQLGLSQENLVKNVVTALNSSINFKPSFWIKHHKGNHYFMGAQYHEESI